MLFYTDVSVQKDHILFSGYENGLKVNKKFLFGPSLYVYNKDGPLKCIDETPLSEKTFDTISQAKEFIKLYSDTSNFKIYGMQDWVYQWIAKTFPLKIAFDPALINTLTFDIEVNSGDNGFPEPKLALYPITAISFHFSTEPNSFFAISTVDYDINKRSVIEDKNVIFYKVENEVELLRTFISIWQSNSPDIVSGYNSQFFDIPYLVNRINRLFGDGFAKCLSPWGTIYEKEKRSNNEMRQFYHIVGIQQLDYLDIIKKFGVALETPENYQLNTVAELIIGEGKVDFSDENISLNTLYTTDPQKFIDYNLKDTYLVVAMEDRVKFLQIAIDLAYKTGANFVDTLGTTAIWDSFIHRVLLKESKIIPPKSFLSIGEDYVGAFVKEPSVGFFKHLVSFDFASLYPNIIIQHNISPETLVTDKEFIPLSPNDFMTKDIINKYPEYSMAANGALFKKDRQGIIPKLVEEIYSERVTIKNEMLEAERELEKTDKNSQDILVKRISILKNSQHSLKILINSVYGAMGSQYFRYYSLRMAEAITLTGQLAFYKTEKAINQQLSKMLKSDLDFVTTGDTDSAYITLDPFVKLYNPKNPIEFMDSIAKDIISPAIEKEMGLMFNQLNGYKPRLIMKRESICSGFFVAKKHYALLIYDAEGGIRLSNPKLKIKGIAAIKSSTPKAIRSKMKEIFMMILTEKSQSDIISFIDEVKNIFTSLPPEKIAFPRGANDIEKWKSDSGGIKKGTPIQVKAAIIYNQLLKRYNLTTKYQQIRSGDKLKFIYLRTPNPIQSSVIGFLNKLPNEFEIDSYIDHKKMFEKTFLDTIDPILEKVGFTSSRHSGIDVFSFFN